MGSTAQKVLDAAMALPEEERLEVATELMASVGGPADPEWEGLWAAELEHRVRDAETSGDHGESWEIVRGRLFPGLHRDPVR